MTILGPSNNIPNSRYTSKKRLGMKSKGVQAFNNFKNFKEENGITDDIEALKEIKEILTEEYSQHQSDDIIYLYLGKCHVRLKEYKEAKIIFSDLINKDEKNTYAHFEYGKLYVILSNSIDEASKKEYLKKAIEEYQKCKADDKYAHLELGKIYMQIGEFEEAIKEFSICIELNPDDNKHAYYNRAHALELLGGSLEQIKQDLEMHLKMNPNDRYALCDLGRIIRLQGDYQKSREHLEESVKQFEKDIYIHYELGLTYKSLIEIDLAINEFKTCIKIYENSLNSKQSQKKQNDIKYKEALYQLAILFRKKSIESNPKESKELLEKSAELYKKCIELCTKDKEIPILHYELGLVFKELNEIEDEMTEFKLCIEKSERINEDEKKEIHNQIIMYSAYELAKISRRMGDYENAEKYLRMSLNICEEEKSAFLHLELGKILKKIGSIESAIHEFELSTQIGNRSLYYGYIELGILYKQKQDYIKAEEMFKTYNKETNYKDAQGILELARLYIEGYMSELKNKNNLKSVKELDDRKKMGIELLKSFMEFCGDTSYKPHFIMAELFLMENKLEDAKKEYKRVIELNKKNDSLFAYLGLGIVEAIEKKDEKAKRLLFSIKHDIKGTESVVEQMRNYLNKDKQKELYRSFYIDKLGDTLMKVKNAMETGKYQYCKGYSWDFYVVKVNKCGYLNENQNELNYVLVCTGQDSKRIITMIPIEGIEELGKQSENLTFTSKNVRDVISNDNAELTPETLELRKSIAKSIEKYMELLHVGR